MNFKTFAQDFCQIPSDANDIEEQRICQNKDNERFIMTTSDHRISFKTGMRTLSHTVTCQALQATGLSNSPISYFEVKVVNVQDKDLQTFAIGLAPFDYPVQRACGSKDSVAIRGDG